MARLTPEVQNDIVAFLRAGGFPEVAAEAAGVPAAQFANWMHRGRNPGEPRRYREFVAAVTQALAQARLTAEVAALKAKPLEWLKAGPGREGWGRDAAPPARPPGLEHPEIRELLARLLAALEPFPEAREAVARAIDG
jgi:hypothetical protein